MVTYEQADFEQVANAIGVDVGQVAKHENLFEAAALTKHRENIIQAIKDGVPAAEVKDDLARIAMRREELQSRITPPRPKTESHRQPGKQQAHKAPPAMSDRNSATASKARGYGDDRRASGSY